MDPVTAEDPPIQLFCLSSQCKMYRIRVQIRNLLAFRKIHFCRFAQSYHHNELSCGPSISKAKCIWKSIWFFAMFHQHHFLVPAVQRQSTLISQRWILHIIFFVCLHRGYRLGEEILTEADLSGWLLQPMQRQQLHVAKLGVAIFTCINSIGGGRERRDSPEQLSLDLAVNTEPSVLTRFFHF